MIKIKKKPSTFNDCTRFISNGFRNFAIEHDNENGLIISSVSTNSDSSLLATKTGVYRKYSNFDLCQIEAVHLAVKNNKNLMPYVEPDVLLSTLPDH